jgi:hypothetical protein
MKKLGRDVYRFIIKRIALYSVSLSSDDMTAFSLLQ